MLDVALLAATGNRGVAAARRRRKHVRHLRHHLQNNSSAEKATGCLTKDVKPISREKLGFGSSILVGNGSRADLQFIDILCQRRRLTALSGYGSTAINEDGNNSPDPSCSPATSRNVPLPRVAQARTTAVQPVTAPDTHRRRSDNANLPIRR